MVKRENYCVDCHSEMGCLGNSCPFINVTTYYCDVCETEADYEIDGDHYCRWCANEYLRDRFEFLPLTERAEMLGIDLRKVDDL